MDLPSISVPVDAGVFASGSDAEHTIKSSRNPFSIVLQGKLFVIKCLHQYAADVHFSVRGYRGTAGGPIMRFGGEV